MAGRELARHRIHFRGPDDPTKYWVIQLAETKRIGPCKTDAGIVSQRPGQPPHRHEIFAVPQKRDGMVKRWFLKVLPGLKTRKPGSRRSRGNMTLQLEDTQRETRTCKRSKRCIGKLRKQQIKTQEIRLDHSHTNNKSMPEVKVAGKQHFLNRPLAFAFKNRPRISWEEFESKKVRRRSREKYWHGV